MDLGPFLPEEPTLKADQRASASQPPCSPLDTQPAGPDTPKLALTSSQALNSQATSWTTSPGAQKDALAVAAPPQTGGQFQALRSQVMAAPPSSASVANPYSIYSLSTNLLGKPPPGHPTLKDEPHSFRGTDPFN